MLHSVTDTCIQSAMSSKEKGTSFDKGIVLILSIGTQDASNTAQASTYLGLQQPPGSIRTAGLDRTTGTTP